MNKTMPVLFLVIFFVSACGPGQIMGQAFTPANADTSAATTALASAFPSAPILTFSKSLIPEGASARLGKGAISDIAISPDGKLLAAATSIGLYLYRMGTWEEVWVKPAAGGMGPVEWSPNGKMLASAMGRGTILVWDTNSGERLHTLQRTGGLGSGPITGIAWSPDSATLVSVSPGSQAWASSAFFWDVPSEKILPAPEFQGDFASVAWSPDGKEIAAGPGAIVIWDAQSRKRKRVFEEPSGGSPVWSPDGARLASASGGGAVILDAATGKRLYSFPIQFSDQTSVAWSPDGKQLVLAGGDANFGSMKVVDSSTGKLLGEFQGHTTYVMKVAWSPDGATVVSSSSDGTLGIWDAKTRQRQQTLTGYYQRLSQAAWSADSTLLAYATDNGTVTVWDVQAGTLLRSFESSSGMAAWAPGGNMLAIGGKSGGITLWDMATGVPADLGLHGHANDVLNNLAWSPNGKRIAIVTKEDFDHWWLAVLDAKTGEELFQIESPPAMHVAWSPDSSLLAAKEPNHAKGAVVVWDAATGQRLREIPFDGLDSDVAWSPDGKILTSSSRKDGLLLWDVATGKSLDRFPKQADLYIHSVAWSPDGRRLASDGWDQTVQVDLWDTANGNRLCMLTGHNASILHLAWSPNGARLASASNDGTIILWDMTREACQATHPLTAHAADTATPAHLILDTPTPAPVPWVSLALGKQIHLGQSAIHDLALSPDKQFLALAMEDSLSLRRADTFEKIWTKRAASGGGMERVEFSPDGKTFAAGESDGGHTSTITVWDVATGKSVSTHKLYFSGVVSDLAWSPDGKLLAAPEGNGYVVTWDPATGEPVYMFGENKRSIASIAWSPDGTGFASGEGNVVTLWDPKSWFLQHTLTGHAGDITRVAWSPDGTMLASGSSDGAVMLWNTATYEILYTLRGHTLKVMDLAWSPDGKTLASASQDNQVILWNAMTGQLVRTLEGHTSWVTSLAWFPDGATLLSASFNGDVILWPVDR
jgi:WD40 repeat protein